MVIQDLGIIELVDSSTLIMGGVKTTANANSKAGSGTAQAGAEAGALGKTTKTVTKTSTSVREDGLVSSSRASGKALSIAKDGNNTSRSSDRSNSQFFGIG